MLAVTKKFPDRHPKRCPSQHDKEVPTDAPVV
jgi:hypothetical protein